MNHIRRDVTRSKAWELAWRMLEHNGLPAPSWADRNMLTELLLGMGTTYAAEVKARQVRRAAREKAEREAAKAAQAQP